MNNWRRMLINALRQVNEAVYIETYAEKTYWRLLGKENLTA